MLSQSVTVADAAPAPATLARTGSASAQLTLLGTLLVAAGVLVLAAHRRRFAPS
ncbi:MAG: LPXTG cell wall anchor domain-containing protein [Acidimicrobiia bacterium]|nr:LPXTG cell wall anchor domain-containing protein [Acidimicrobiia bacterium]